LKSGYIKSGTSVEKRRYFGSRRSDTFCENFFMEWQVKPISRRCAVSDQPFVAGNRVVCVIYKPENAPLERADVLAENFEKLKLNGVEIGRWTRVVKDANAEEREAQQQLLATREEFFLSLFADESDTSSEKKLLKQLLALLLERKRILRAIGRPEGSLQRYLHVRTKDEFFVPTDVFLPEEIAQIQPVLETLLG